MIAAPRGEAAASPDGTAMTAQAFRLGLAAEHDPQGAALAITAPLPGSA